MQALREVVSRDIFKNYDIPKELGDKFEMILLPIDDSKKEHSMGNRDVDSNKQFLAASYNVVIEDNEKENDIWSKYL